MNPEQFTQWLAGFAELHPEPPSAGQWQSIREHLALVFKKVTPEIPKKVQPVPFAPLTPSRKPPETWPLPERDDPWVPPVTITCKGSFLDEPVLPNAWNFDSGVTDEQLAALIPIARRQAEAQVVDAIERGDVSSEVVDQSKPPADDDETAEVGGPFELIRRRVKEGMRLTYDGEVDAAYLYLKETAPGEAKRTVLVKKLGNDVALDLDAAGRVIGIEFLAPTRMLPAELLEQAERLDVR